MTLFNFESTGNYKKIPREPIFEFNIKKIIIIFIITFTVGILLGLFFNDHTIGAIKYVGNDGVSAKALDSAQVLDKAFGSPLYTLIAIFFNNLLISGLLIVFPIHLYGMQKQATNNWTSHSLLEKLNPAWVSYAMVGFQMIMVGNFIGYAIPIINNNALVVASLIPHGIIEIPIILISSAIGMSFATKDIYNKFTYNDCLNFFVKYIIPVMMLAAFIEAYITPVIVTLIK
jgi:hypothetical protein